MKRILFVSHTFDRNGAPTILANLLPELRELGLDCCVHSLRDGPLRERFVTAGVPIVETLEVKGFDLVVANTIAAALGIEIARRAHVPAMWMIHESRPDMCGNLLAVQATISYPTTLIFPCWQTAREYDGFSVNRSVVVPTVIPESPNRDRDECRKKLGFAPDDVIVLAVGTIEPRKGQHDLATAAAGLPRVRVMLVGDTTNTSYVDACKRTASNLTVVGSVDDPWTYYAAADCFVSCSTIEAFPLTLQEAAAYRLPIITTPVFGCKEIIHEDYHGSYTPPGNPTELRRKLMHIIESDEHRAKIIHPLTHLPSHRQTVHDYREIFNGRYTHAGGALRVVWHCAGIGSGWREVVDEQLALLARVGLIRQVYCTHVGVGLEWIMEEARRKKIDLVVCQHEDDVGNCEALAMRLVERLARSGDGPILYFHTKGVSHPNDLQRAAWRRVMQRHVVEHWRENVAFLESNEYDTVGVNWWFNSTHHYSGNFWMARADWIRKLPAYQSYHYDRYSSEIWIGATKGCRAKSLFCNDQMFWVTGVPAG